MELFYFQVSLLACSSHSSFFLPLRLVCTAHLYILVVRCRYLLQSRDVVRIFSFVLSFSLVPPPLIAFLRGVGKRAPEYFAQRLLEISHQSSGSASAPPPNTLYRSPCTSRSSPARHYDRDIWVEGRMDSAATCEIVTTVPAPTDRGDLRMHHLRNRIFD